jgi:hypothetical protein
MLKVRRPHEKSRTGCMTCKRKKIKVSECLDSIRPGRQLISLTQSAFKCDELKPSCQYCTLRSMKCTYLTPKSSSPNGHINPSPEIPTPLIKTPSTSGSSRTLSTGYPTVGAQWSIHDLELLHFYTISTSQTFSNFPDMRHVWQSVVPQMAFSHGFLSSWAPCPCCLASLADIARKER